MSIDDDNVRKEIVEAKGVETGDDCAMNGVSNAAVMPLKLMPIPRPLPLTPQRIKNKEEEDKSKHFLSMLN